MSKSNEVLEFEIREEHVRQSYRNYFDESRPVGAFATCCMSACAVEDQLNLKLAFGHFYAWDDHIKGLAYNNSPELSEAILAHDRLLHPSPLTGEVVLPTEDEFIEAMRPYMNKTYRCIPRDQEKEIQETFDELSAE